LSCTNLLFLPLQGLAAWRGLEVAQSLAYRAGRVQQARLAQFRQAVERSATIAELQGQLAAIQVPPLSAADQRQGLPALKAIGSARSRRSKAICSTRPARGCPPRC